MQVLNALALTSHVNEWLGNTRKPRILHVFDHALNLINEYRDVLSVVTPKIGNGPFNLVVDDDILFSEHLNAETLVSILKGRLQIGGLIISMKEVIPWNPRPNWKELHRNKEVIMKHVTELSIVSCSSQISLFSTSLLVALADADLHASLAAAQKLAGLGPGLTPSGDDFIMGAIYATWIIHPFEIAGALIKEIAENVIPLTTSLSAACIRSAGRGEAGILWHEFFEALLAGGDLQLPITKLLSVGETSGADAFSGFMGVFHILKNV